MTGKKIKTIIKLYNSDNRDEKIIKQKGNKKCIFYSDDVCRKGDRTRDCINCARIEYQSLYSLNWDNQERLQKQLQRKKQECQRLENENKRLVGKIANNVFDEQEKIDNHKH